MSQRKKTLTEFSFELGLGLELGLEQSKTIELSFERKKKITPLATSKKKYKSPIATFADFCFGIGSGRGFQNSLRLFLQVTFFETFNRADISTHQIRFRVG